jgi:hypothetical protein
MSDIPQSLLSAIDDQLRSPQTPYVRETHQRLLASGMSDAQAREEMADCLGDEIGEMMAKKRVFDEARYRALLDALPWEEEPDSDNDLQRL